jgi:AcrR family transcriptional regulator
MKSLSPSNSSPRPRDADATRERLLATAEDVFTKFGFDGARVDDIAQCADVNKRMIYVYFGDKEGLYRAVLRNAVERIATATEMSLTPSDDPCASLKSWIAGYFGFLAQHPELVKLVEWELLSDGTRTASAVAEVAKQEIIQLTSLLNSGKSAGQFRQDINPDFVLMMIHALCFGTLSRRQLWSSLWNLDLASPETVTSVTEFITETVILGISAKSPTNKRVCTKESAP